MPAPERRLVPLPPSRLVGLSVGELRLLVAALDNAESDIRREAPEERVAHRSIAILRAKLRRALEQLEV